MPVPPSFHSFRLARPAQSAGITWYRVATRGLLAVAGGVVLTAAVASDRVDILTNDQREITGVVIRDAQDGSLLLEHEDGRYELLRPADIARRAAAAEPLVCERPADFGRKVLAELPAGFDLLITKHYVICFDTTREYAQWCAALFERLHDAFGNFWRRAGLEINDPDRPLIVVIFADRRVYEAHAAADLGAAADRVVGYYNLLSNRITTFDLTGSELLVAERRRQPGRVAMTILSNPAAASLVSTLVHEATHQLAFNDGMHRRLAPVPLWVSEGIATYFETPDLEHARAWRAVGAVNRPRLEHFLKTYQAGCVEAMVRGDEAFREPNRAVDSYATAWAVCHHLLRVKKGAFVEYLRGLAAKKPLDEDSAEERLAEFRAAFGDPVDVEQAVFKGLARLASHPH
jgi:hypothetical protein